jgi:hypothetical protein
MVIRNWTDWHLEKGAMEAAGEKSPQKRNPSHGKMKPSTALGRRNGGTPVGSSGQKALRSEQCNKCVHC